MVSVIVDDSGWCHLLWMITEIVDDWMVTVIVDDSG